MPDPQPLTPEEEAEMERKFREATNIFDIASRGYVLTTAVAEKGLRLLATLRSLRERNAELEVIADRERRLAERLGFALEREKEKRDG